MIKRANTIKVILSGALSTLGNTIAAVVLPLVLLAETGDPLAAGVLALACGVPQFLIGIVGGALLDKYNRRNISVVSDVISAFSIIALPVIYMTVGLNLKWFIIFGIIGAIGDIPGMTARSVILPSAAEYDKLEYKRYVGISHGTEAAAVVFGPAVGAVLISTVGNINTLWVIGALSLSAAIVTSTVEKSIGITNKEANKNIISSLKEGVESIFKKDAMILSLIFLSIGSVVILACYQGLIFPVYFTEIDNTKLLGYALSALAVGAIFGAAIYTVLVDKLKNRTWYLLSLTGMAVAMTLMGLLLAYPLILLGAFLTGLCSGPFAALLDYILVKRVSEDERGTIMGIQNSLLLLATPLGIFISSILVTELNTKMASYILVGVLWIFTFVAIKIKSMKDLNNIEE